MPGPDGPLYTRLPCLLSETGLYQADMVTLADGVHPYAPSFQLWTDGAEKKRFILLPQGSTIDTTDMDFWQFPPGTKLWKEFARNGIRVETRLLQKQPSGAWQAVAYHWRADQTEADAVPNGVQNASGTPHDIPNTDDCMKCHSQQPDKVLGFSAIQLSHEKVDAANPLEWTLETLMADGLLTAPPAGALSVPGTDVERNFFGYLHANCGHCHNPTGSGNSQTGLDLWLRWAELGGPIQETTAFKAVYDADIVWLGGARPEATKRIDPGVLENSALYQRFIAKGEEWSMPPLGTEDVDPAGKEFFETFINSLALP
jgi:hypothetical protein